VLDRGFALVVGPGGATVRSAGQVKTGDALMIRVSEGDFGATVSGPGGPKSRRSLPRRSVGGEQGELL
jgi:exonuclease VII large subunit